MRLGKMKPCPQLLKKVVFSRCWEFGLSEWCRHGGIVRSPCRVGIFVAGRCRKMVAPKALGGLLGLVIGDIRATSRHRNTR